MNYQGRFVGLSITRFTRIPGGPLEVWSILFRIGGRKQLVFTDEESP